MNRLYTGKIKACILDWSGTICDKYVIAPAIVFQKIFENYGVEVTMDEVRKPMGLRKDLHIKDMLLNNENVRLATTLYKTLPPQVKERLNSMKDYILNYDKNKVEEIDKSIIFLVTSLAINSK